MDNIQIVMAILWVCLMLTYLWGDVLSVLAGDSKPRELEGKKVGQRAWAGIAIIQAVPIIMAFLSVVLPVEANRWANMLVAGFFFLFNLAGMQGYKPYHTLLLILGLMFLVLIVVFAWIWDPGWL